MRSKYRSLEMNEMYHTFRDQGPKLFKELNLAELRGRAKKNQSGIECGISGDK